jgi:hypothetical protein
LEVKVSAVSPLAMAQNMDEINGIMQYYQIAQGLGPEGQMAVKVGEALDYIGDKLGIPANLRNSVEERGQMMEEMAQQAAAIAQAERAQQGQPGMQQEQGPPGAPPPEAAMMGGMA